MSEQYPAAAEPIRIVLLCENPIVYQTLGSRLNADLSFVVAGTYDCIIDQVPVALAHQPHVVILGISRITHFNMLICQALRQASTQVRIVVLPSYFDTPEDTERAHTCGADIVLEKSIDTPALMDQIRRLVNPVA
jgi:DNA-binding NarL/FixJ family response regulator